MRRFYIAYTPEPGRPDPTPEAIFRLLGIRPADRPDVWRLLTHIADRTNSLVIAGSPSDLGATPFEVALVLYLCAAHRMSVHIVATKTQIVAEVPTDEQEHVYRTTTELAELAKMLFNPPGSLL